MLIVFFLIDDKDGESYFLKKIFLLTDISMNIAFKMFFLILSNVKVNFTNQELK